MVCLVGKLVHEFPQRVLFKLTNFMRVRDNRRHVVPFVRARAHIEPSTVDPDTHWERRLIVNRRAADNVQRQTCF